MVNTFLKQLWLAIRIWLFAVTVNTILGTIFLTAINFLDAGSLLMFGSCYGALFSFPVMIAILVIINRYSAADKSGLVMFRAVFNTGVALTVVVFMVFWFMMGLRGIMMCVILQCIALLSGILSMTAFNRSILKWGRVRNNVQKYSHENKTILPAIEQPDAPTGCPAGK
jgi:hypothetical protein